MRSFPNNLEKVTLIAPAAVTLFVTNSFNTDPVNVTKMLLLSSLAIGILGLIVAKYKELQFNALYFSLSLGFFASILLSGIFSKSPFTLSFYGADGRNTGILTYACLVVMFIAASQVRNIRNIRTFNILFALVGTTTVIYGLLQMQGFEFLDWNNVYNSALGTFGNPNFFASFTGMTVSALIPFLFGKISKTKLFLGFIYIAVASVSIVQSKSIQGLATIFIGGAVGLGIWIYCNKSKLLLRIYLLLITLISIAGLGGMLQFGPLSSFIYKPSVSLRGFYWHAGMEMFKNNWLFGVGPDSYGNWYRTYRSEFAILPPGGVDVNSNAAHNVFIDLAANGGIIVIGFYLAIIILLLLSVVRNLKSNKTFNSTYVSLVALWISYLAQSLISINQIGLAIWGWVSSGLLLAPCFNNHLGNESISNSKKKKTFKKNSQSDFTNFALGLGMCIGFVIALPPFLADHNWYKALRSGKVDQFISAAQAEPINSKRMFDAANILEQNKYYAESKKLNKLARDFDPNFYYNWLAMYNNSEATEQEKNQARENLHRLDPLNPAWK